MKHWFFACIIHWVFITRKTRFIPTERSTSCNWFLPWSNHSGKYLAIHGTNLVSCGNNKWIVHSLEWVVDTASETPTREFRFCCVGWAQNRFDELLCLRILLLRHSNNTIFFSSDTSHFLQMPVLPDRQVPLAVWVAQPAKKKTSSRVGPSDRTPVEF